MLVEIPWWGALLLCWLGLSGWSVLAAGSSTPLRRAMIWSAYLCLSLMLVLGFYDLPQPLVRDLFLVGSVAAVLLFSALMWHYFFFETDGDEAPDGDEPGTALMLLVHIWLIAPLLLALGLVLSRAWTALHDAGWL